MRYILNVPQKQEEIFNSPEFIASAIVTMGLAPNMSVIADRIRDLNETDVMQFGTTTVIAVQDEGIPTIHPPSPLNTTPMTRTEVLPAREQVAEAVVGERITPQPMTTDKAGRPKVKTGSE